MVRQDPTSRHTLPRLAGHPLQQVLRLAWTLRRQYPLEGYRRLAFMMLDRNVVAVSPSGEHWTGWHCSFVDGDRLTRRSQGKMEEPRTRKALQAKPLFRHRRPLVNASNPGNGAVPPRVSPTRRTSQHPARSNQPPPTEGSALRSRIAQTVNPGRRVGRAAASRAAGAYRGRSADRHPDPRRRRRGLRHGVRLIPQSRPPAHIPRER